MKRITLMLVITGLCLSLTAQKSLDILTLSGRYGFPQAYESTYTGEASETGTFLNLVVPVPFSEKTIWYNSLNHFYFNVQGDQTIPDANVNPIVLNGFILRTGLYQKFDNGTAIQVLFAPRFMTDFNDVNSKSFQFGGVFLFENVFSESLKMSFGATYNQELFGPLLVPIVSLDWDISPKWNINGMLPIYAKVNYKANEKLTVGFSHFGLVTTYYLGDPDYAGDYIERQSIDLTLFAKQKVAKNLFIEGRAGMAVGRSYEQFAGDQKVGFSLPLVGFGDERIAKNVNFNNGMILDFRLIYSIPLPD